MLTSTRRSISYPNTDFSDRPNVPAHMLNLVNALEIDLVYAQGLSTSRTGRTHLEGTFFYETDTQLSYYDDGVTWRRVSGSSVELDYAQITSDATISATTEGTSQTVVAGNSITLDGSPILIEFFAPSWDGLNVAANITFLLYDGATLIGQLCRYSFGASTVPNSAVTGRYKLTPSAGSHQYIVKAFCNPSGKVIKAGSGGTGAYLPAFLRVTRA